MRDLKRPAEQPTMVPVGGLMPTATPGHLIRHGPNGATLGKVAWHDDKPHYGNRQPGKLFKTRTP